MSTINLPEALKSEAMRIWQLVLNANTTTWGGGGVPDLPYEWPEQNKVVYKWNGVELILDNIHVTDLSDFNWGQESINSSQREQYIKDHINIGLGTSITRKYTHSFAKVKTMEESAKQGFETEVSARLGTDSSFVGLNLSQKFSLEFNKSFGNSDTFSDEITDELTFVGPKNSNVVAYRDRQTVQRRMTTNPKFDYSITFYRWALPYGQKMTLANKAELLDLVKGQAPDTVGRVYTVKTSSTPVVSEFFRSAPAYRRNPQPNAAIDNANQTIEWVRDYNKILNQGIEEVPLEA